MRWIIAALLLWSGSAQARDPDGRYANSPHREWYQTRQLTPEAQARLHFKSCCAHSDVVRTKFRPLPNGGDGWEYLNAAGKWVRVPNDIIHWGASTPTGEPVLFAISEVPVCFFPGEGGI